MQSDSLRRTEDQFEHQQNEPTNVDRDAASRKYGAGGAGGAGGHYDAPGSASDHVRHAFGQYEDPSFRPDHTVDAAQTERPVRVEREDGTYGLGEGPHVASTAEDIAVLCGPLLNYRRMSGEKTHNPIWHGSVLLVTTPGQQRPPRLFLRAAGSAQSAGAGAAAGSVDASLSSPRDIVGEKLYEDPKAAFYRFLVEVPFLQQESAWEYSIPGVKYVDSKKTADPARKVFHVPSKHESMRIMFHSCNGFSVGTDTDAWSGCALWNDVLRVHEERPFHVMIGGGDQIYNDGVRVDGPLRAWTDIGSPVKRRNFPFNEELRAKCDQYYFDNYVRWYGTEPFAFANGQIPQLNIWDDHDIIDGFGSYTDHFMKCAVFRGIGGVAHKYYLLFQHHIPPPASTFTTDAPATMRADEKGTSGADAVQLKDTFVKTGEREDPSYIIGTKPGPYVEERSRSIYSQLGARIAFVGIDARTERTRHQINYPETYEQIFHRVDTELNTNQNIQHLIVLLGVPIAYPRLQWLENILQSPIIGPIRFLNKRFGVAGGLFNHFDGQVDLLDDLDDHYTAHQHKRERKELVLRLQKLAKQHSARVTILGGDVHLAAFGRFYSNPKLNIPTEKDFRYMANVISSAITNKPPPAAVANLLASRNKIHHLDSDTDETLLNLFDMDPGKGEPGVKDKTKDSNHCTMPSRNYAILSESHDHASLLASLSPPHSSSSSAATANGHPPPPSRSSNTPPGIPTTSNGHLAPSSAYNPNPTPSTLSSSSAAAASSGPPTSDRPTTGLTTATNGTTPTEQAAKYAASAGKSNPRNALHAGEAGAGTAHPAAAPALPRSGLGGKYGLDVVYRVEVSPSDRHGRTQGYGLTIPGLVTEGYKNFGTKW